MPGADRAPTIQGVARTHTTLCCGPVGSSLSLRRLLRQLCTRCTWELEGHTLKATGPERRAGGGSPVCLSLEDRLPPSPSPAPGGDLSCSLPALSPAREPLVAGPGPVLVSVTGCATGPLLQLEQEGSCPCHSRVDRLQGLGSPTTLLDGTAPVPPRRSPGPGGVP